MLVYVECECFVMQMLYVCVLCASCGSSQCCVLHDLQFASSADVTLALSSLITSTNWQTKTNLGSAHLQIIISLKMDVTINPIQHRSSINLKRATGTDTVERLKTSRAKYGCRATAKKEKYLACHHS